MRRWLSRFLSLSGAIGLLGAFNWLVVQERPAIAVFVLGGSTFLFVCSLLLLTGNIDID